MARPKYANRSEVKTVTLTLKVTKAERKRLNELAAARAKELQERTGQRIAVSASALIRWLMDREADQRGLGPGGRG